MFKNKIFGNLLAKKLRCTVRNFSYKDTSFGQANKRNEVERRDPFDDNNISSRRKGKDGMGTYQPNSRFKELSLPRDVKQYMQKSYFPFNYQSIFQIFNNINKFISSHFIIGKTNDQIIISCIFYFSHHKRDVYFLVDSDEMAFHILEQAGAAVSLPAVYIKNSSNLKLMDVFGIPFITVINYENVGDQWVDHINTEMENYIVFYKIKDEKFKLDPWLQLPKNKKIIAKSSIYTVFETFSDLKKILNNTKKSLDKFFYTLQFNKEEENNLVDAGISRYGMNFNHSNFITVATECAKKYLRQNKKVLIICEKDSHKLELEKEFYIDDSNAKEELDKILKIQTLSEVKDILNSEEDIENEKHKNFNVVLECPYTSKKNFFLICRKFIKNSTWDIPIMISLFKPGDMQQIADLRQQDVINIKFKNLLSSSFLINDKSEIVNPKSEELQKLIQNKTETEFWTRIDKFFKMHESPEAIKHFDNFYDTFKNNPSLSKKVCQILFKQNFKDFFSHEKEDISLITGEKGVYTCFISCETIKQLEERYFVTKFLLRHGLCEVAEYEKKVFRVYGGFEFVFDIPVERFNEIKQKAKEIGLKIEICYNLPIIFYHQYSEWLKNKN